VIGGDLVRQTRGGLTESIFGTVYDGVKVMTTPALSEDDARTRLAVLAGARLPADRLVELVILPKEEGGYALTWRTHFWTAQHWMQTFLDAQTGTTMNTQPDDRSGGSCGRLAH
jgi:hypothetical protein